MVYLYRLGGRYLPPNHTPESLKWVPIRKSTLFVFTVPLHELYYSILSRINPTYYFVLLVQLLGKNLLAHVSEHQN